MSANNFIKIDKKYRIWICDAETGEGHIERKGRSLKDALKKAIEVNHSQDVEYGIQIIECLENKEK